MKKVSRDTLNGAPGPVARFEVSEIPLNQRSGEFSVRVRMCPFPVDSSFNVDWCGGYGPAGSLSLNLPPGPGSFTSTGTTASSVALTWDAVAGATAYEFDYRVQGDTEWQDVENSVTGTSTTISRLACNTTYEFVVRAFGDGSAYATEWGF